MSVLADYFSLQRGNTYKSALLGQPGPVLLGLGSIARNGGFKGENLKTYGGPSDPRILLGPGDIYVSLKDVTQSADLLGAVARVPSQIAQGRLTQDTVKLVFKTPNVPKDYLYWLLQTPDYRAYCKAHSTGTTNLGLAREDFLAFPVPPLTPARQWIVDVVRLAEDKIELNRRMNETLEVMAHAIFRDWFVDFGPVRRKLAGATDPVEIMGHLTTNPTRAAELARLFPDSLTDDLPATWEWAPLSDILVLQRGFDLPKTTRTDGNFPVIAASGPSGTHNEFKVRGPGVCTGRSGVLGGVYFVPSNFWPLNTSLWIKDYPASTPLLAFHLLREIDLASYNAGSAVPTLNRNHVHGLKTTKAPSSVIAAFDKIGMSLYAKIGANDAECRSLVETRDYLLPRLMSGAVRVSPLREPWGG